MAQKHLLTVDSTKNIMDVKILVPSFEPADAQAFIADYNSKVKEIDPSQFTLTLDCTGMSVVTKEMVPELEACYNLYKESGFNKVEFQIKENVILNMQLSRLARNSGLTQSVVVNV